MQSTTADQIAWTRHAEIPPPSPSPSAGAHSRIDFKDCETPVPLRAGIREAGDIAIAMNGKRRRKRLLVITGRSRRLAVENHRVELKELMEEFGSVASEVGKTIGDVATAFVVAGCGEGVVVVQAANSNAGQES